MNASQSLAVACFLQGHSLALPALVRPQRFSGANFVAMNDAPCGSAITVILAQGTSIGGTSTLPPSSVALAASASASSMENVTLQWAGTSGSSSPIGLMLATTSSKPGAGAELRQPRAQPGLSLFEVIAVAGQRPQLGVADA